MDRNQRDRADLPETGQPLDSQMQEEARRSRAGRRNRHEFETDLGDIAVRKPEKPQVNLS
jgi:hypothetical protein